MVQLRKACPLNRYDHHSAPGMRYIRHSFGTGESPDGKIDVYLIGNLGYPVALFRQLKRLKT